MMSALRASTVVLVVLVVLVVIAALGATVAVAPVGGAAEGERRARAERVVIVSVPTLTWDLVADEQPPVLTGLFEQSAVASASVRTFGTDTSPGEGYGTVGAGNRAATYDDLAGQAFPPDDDIDGAPAAEVLSGRSGQPVEAAAVVHVGAPAITRLNDALLNGAEPGALGRAVAGAGGTSAVIANADLEADIDLDVERGAVRREAALAMMDRHGVVPAGSVAPDLLVVDSRAPFGVRLDPDAVLDAFDDVADAEVVLVELSDLRRADELRAVASRNVAADARRSALVRTDELLGGLLDRIDLGRELVIVVAPTAPQGPAQLTVAAVAGPEVRIGLAKSGSTRRPGYVTLPDVAPTALRWLGIDQPGVMNGAAITGGSGAAPDASTWADLALDNELALFRNAVTGPLTVTFIVVLVVALALTAAALTWHRPILRGLAAHLLLLALAVPFVTFLAGFVREDRVGVPGAVVATFAVASLFAALVQGAGTRAGLRRGEPGASPRSLRASLVPPLLVLVPTALLLLVDILLGGPLQIDTAFGYGGGAIVAGRFSGYGNLAWGLLAVAAITSVTAAWGRAHLRQPLQGRRRRVALVAVSAASVLLTLAVGLPQLGQNVGGTLAVVPGAIVLVCTLAGIRLGLRRVVLIALATVGVLATFGTADYARPPEQRTHLGRLIDQTLGDQGASGLATVLERKVTANLNILTSSVWTLVIPAALAFLGFLLWRPPQFLRTLLASLPGLRACLVATFVTGILAAVLNDSGIAIPAVMLTLLLPYLGYLALRAVPVTQP